MTSEQIQDQIAVMIDEGTGTATSATMIEVIGGWTTVHVDGNEPGVYHKVRNSRVSPMPERTCGGCQVVLGASEGIASGLCQTCRDEQAEADMQADVDLVMNGTGSGPKPERTEAEPLPLCSCLCGSRVRYPGRMFLQGHDQRHKGNLLRAVGRLDQNAAYELVKRSWKSADEVAYLWSKAQAKANPVVHAGEASDTPPA